ncbi:unnamed protein product, partial [Amoebophrya sp. A120]|eukprot:GSA120T00024533001.1
MLDEEYHLPPGQDVAHNSPGSSSSASALAKNRGIVDRGPLTGVPERLMNRSPSQFD